MLLSTEIVRLVVSKYVLPNSMAYVAIVAILVLSCGCAADALRAADIVGLYDPSERA